MERNFSTTGTYLLKIPPFRDSHMHFLEDGKPASQEQLLEIKDKYKKHGIFSVNDMGHKTGIGLDAKKVIKRDMLIRSAGFAIYKKKGYGTFLGKGVTGKEEIQSVIKDISNKGADFIKVINSGIVCPKGGG